MTISRMVWHFFSMLSLAMRLIVRVTELEAIGISPICIAGGGEGYAAVTSLWALVLPRHPYIE